MSIRRILWKGIYYNTLEYLHIQSDTAPIIEGNITGLVNEQPLHIRYKIETNTQWEMSSVHITVLDYAEKELQFIRRDGRWHDKQGTIHGIFDACVDIDISLTPFTNTLPINRLKMSVGASEEITVLYFDLPTMDVKPAKQRYTRLAEDRYRYESLSSGFTAEVVVDEEGFVVNYPEIWTRLH